MTGIVADLEGMAADSKVVYGSVHHPGQKIYVFGRTIVGIAGSGASMSSALSWFEAGRPRKTPERKNDGEGSSFDALVLNDDGLFVMQDDYRLEPVLHIEFHAIGSGAAACLAAMHCGKRPWEAVAVACMIDNDMGGPVTYRSLASLAKPDRRGR